MVVTKTDATARKDVKVLELMAEKVLAKPSYQVPEGYKRVEEVHKFVEYKVPS